MKLGDLEFGILTDGGFRLDGGAMFGVIPKPLWERKFPADQRNRIALSMNCLLIRAPGHSVLVESGAGDKWDAKSRDIFAFDQSGRLLEQLSARGLAPEDISVVINSHLHFDHCGWNTRLENGIPVPTFPRARYLVQRGELEHASNPTERDRASYLSENFLPLSASGQLEPLDGDSAVLPGIELIRVPGHTRDMQCVRLTGGGRTAFFFADLVPTTAHLPFPWIMGYDLFPMTTLENKKKWIPQAAREGWLCLFAHDPNVKAAYLREKDGKIVPEPVALD